MLHAGGVAEPVHHEVAVGGGKMREEVKSMYLAGKVRMAMAADGVNLVVVFTHWPLRHVADVPIYVAA